MEKTTGRTRWLIILSAIINLMFSVLICLGSIYLFFLAIDNMDPLIVLASLAMYPIFMFIICMIVFIIGIIIFVGAIIQIRTSTLPSYEFARKKGTIITYIVLDIVVVLFAILAFMYLNVELPMALIVILPFSVSAVLKIIDSALFWSNVKRGKISIERPATNYSNIRLDAINPKFALENELKNLNKMKAENLITEEEYQKLRKKSLDTYENKLEKNAQEDSVEKKDDK